MSAIFTLESVLVSPDFCVVLLDCEELELPFATGGGANGLSSYPLIDAWSSAMIDQPFIRLDRRSLLIKAAAMSATLIIPHRLAAAELAPTPGQTEGPFYPVEFRSDLDNDLVRAQVGPLKPWDR